MITTAVHAWNDQLMRRLEHEGMMPNCDNVTTFYSTDSYQINRHFWANSAHVISTFIRAAFVSHYISSASWSSMQLGVMYCYLLILSLIMPYSTYGWILLWPPRVLIWVTGSHFQCAFYASRLRPSTSPGVYQSEIVADPFRNRLLGSG